MPRPTPKGSSSSVSEGSWANTLVSSPAEILRLRSRMTRRGDENGFPLFFFYGQSICIANMDARSLRSHKKGSIGPRLNVQRTIGMKRLRLPCRDRRPRLSKKQGKTKKHPKDDTLEDENRFSFAFFGGSKPPPYELTFLLFYKHRITEMYGI